MQNRMHRRLYNSMPYYHHIEATANRDTITAMDASDTMDSKDTWDIKDTVDTRH